MKTEIKTTIHVDYGDLERQMQEVYGFPYEMACDMEVGNDTSHEFDDINIKEAEEARDDECDAEDLQDWIDSGGKKQMWGPRFMLLDMVLKGLIPEGDYVVRISW